MPATKEPDATELNELRKRIEANELRATDFETQLRVIEARFKLTEAQNKLKQVVKAAATKK